MYFALLLLSLLHIKAPATNVPKARPASSFYLVCSHAGYNLGCDAQAQCKTCSMACKKADASLPLAEDCSLIIDSVTIASPNGTPIYVLKQQLPFASAELMPQTDPTVLFLRINARGKPPLMDYYAYEIKNSMLTPESTSLTCIDAPSGRISATAGSGFACYFRNDFFETSVPVIYSFEKHEFALLDDPNTQFSVRPMSTPAPDGAPAQPLHRISPIAPAAAAVELCADHDASASCEKVGVAANTAVRLLGSWAPLQANDPQNKAPAQLHLKLDLSDAWLHVDLNGSHGWIHGEHDVRAIGLPVPAPRPSARHLQDEHREL